MSMSMRRALLVVAAAGLGLGLAGGPEAFAKRPANCVIKAGEASGLTRGFAEYESLLIIEQVTGNWPVKTDRIGKPIYRCKQNAAGWTCVARAEVCKG